MEKKNPFWFQIKMNRNSIFVFMENRWIQKFFQNKYWIILVIFSIWMIFFDSNSIITHYELNQELEAITLEKEFLKQTIKKEKKEYQQLKKSSFMMEKLARERYFFKKDNEDLFIIETIKQKNDKSVFRIPY